MRIVSRAEWGARPPRTRSYIDQPTPRLWVHHTATEQHGAAGVREIQRYHQDTKGWADIAYSFLVDDDGLVYEGRGAGVAGAHTEGDNSTSHAICLMGNLENRAPTPAAVTALVELARHGRDHGWWVPTLGGHRDAPGASTACPGRHLYAQLPTVRARVAGQAPEVDDMTPDDHKKIRQAVHDEVRGEVQRLGQYLAAGQGNQAFNPQLQTWMRQAVTLPKLAAAVAGIEGLDELDEAAIAAALRSGLAVDIAAAIPSELARDVVEALTAELAD